MRKLMSLVKGTAIAVLSGIVQMVIAVGLLTVWPYRLATGVEIDAWLVYSILLGFLVGLIVGASIAKAHLSERSATQPADDTRKSASRRWVIVYICCSVVCAVVAVVTLSRSLSDRDAIGWAQFLYFDALIAMSVAFYAGYWRLIQFMKSGRIFQRLLSPAIERLLSPATKSPQRKAAVATSIIVAAVLWFSFADSMLTKRLQAQYLFGRRDFSGATLNDADLSELNLSNANLSGADLSDSDLGYINLSAADLRDADLKGANLAGADLRGADLRNADLEGANLFRADLSGANLMGAELDGSELTKADLRGANLATAHLRRNDLHETSIDSQTVWPDPKWERCWAIVNLGGRGRLLKGADLSWTVLDRADLRGAILSDADLTGARLSGASMQGVDLSGANLNAAVLDHTDLTGANLSGANLDSALLYNTYLVGSDLTGAILTNARLDRTSLDRAEYDEDTIWPPTVDPAKLGAIKVD